MPASLPPPPPPRPRADGASFILPPPVEPTAAEQAQQRADDELIEAASMSRDEWTRRCVAAGLVEVPDLKSEVEHYLRTGRVMQIDVPAQPSIDELPDHLKVRAQQRVIDERAREIEADKKAGRRPRYL